MTIRIPRTLPWCGALLATLALGPGLAAQDPAPDARPRSGVIGRVYDERTNEVVTQALILVNGERRDITLSQQGRFVVTGLPAGGHRIEVRVIGYRPYVLEVTLGDGQILERRFPMIFTGDRLPDIRVESRASKLLPRFADFERRRNAGLGTYITRDEIRARGYLNMGDALRTLKGVRVDCSPFDCLIRMARSSPQCYPAFWVDGVRARSFASTTPIVDIQGIEVYRGPSDAPGEFGGDGAGCGVIVIWTRAAP